MRKTCQFAMWIFGLAYIVPALAWSNCNLMEGQPFPPGTWTVKTKQIRSLVSVVARLSSVIGLDANLVLCESLDANAFATIIQGEQYIFASTELLRLTEDDDDALAAVMGHEVAHLRHRHAEERAAIAADAQRRVVDAYNSAVARGERRVKARTAAQSEVTKILSGLAAFSRAQEDEADAEGISLMVRAGFAPAGGRRMAEKMAAQSGDQPQGYFSTHPAWRDRMKANLRLESLEGYRASALELAAAKKLPQLDKLLTEWEREIPGTGAAAYYGGVLGLFRGSPTPELTDKFDEALNRFDGGTFSRAAQAFQEEAEWSAEAMCISLFRDNRKLDALNCVQGLLLREQVDRFKAATGWTTFVWIPQPQLDSRLYADKIEDGVVSITNCKYIAAMDALRPTRNWRATRSSPESERNGGLETIQCDPAFCNCSPKSPDDLPMKAIREELGQTPW